jgi:hypothetical protein
MPDDKRENTEQNNNDSTSTRPPESDSAGDPPESRPSLAPEPVDLITTRRVSDADKDVIKELDAALAAQVPLDSLALFVGKESKPLLITHSIPQLILGRGQADAKLPVLDLVRFGAVELGISRHHALISFSHDSYMLQDLGSTNGTWLGDTRLVPGHGHELQPNDVIRLGKLYMRVYYHRPRMVGAIMTLQLDHRPRQIITQDRDRLTAARLHEHLEPFLAALTALQHLIDDLLLRPRTMVLIRSIHSEPVRVELSGAEDAIQLLEQVIAPWEKVFIKDIGDILTLWEQGLSKSGSGKLTRRETGELFLMKPIGSNQPVNPLIRKLQKPVQQLAIQVLERVKPDLSGAEKMKLVETILPPLTTLVLNEYMLRPEENRSESKPAPATKSLEEA